MTTAILTDARFTLPLFTPAEVAVHLGLPESTVRAWLGLGEQPMLVHRWRVREVVVHLRCITEWTPRRLITGLIGAGGKADRCIATDALSRAATPSSELLQSLHLSVGARRHPRPPNPPGCSAITSATPRTSSGRYPSLGSSPRPTAHGGRCRARDLHLAATDLDWTHGHGPQVAEATEALIMALAGRRDASASWRPRAATSRRDRRDSPLPEGVLDGADVRGDQSLLTAVPAGAVVHVLLSVAGG